MKHIYVYVTLLLILLMGLACVLLPAFAHAEVVYECTLANGSRIYTNKVPKGATCVPIRLPQIGSVPDRHAAPSMPGSVTMAPSLEQDRPSHEHDYPLLTDLHGGFAINPSIGHNVAEQVCDLYGKWLDLSLQTRGGLFYDAKTAPLLSMFGGGFIPMECRR